MREIFFVSIETYFISVPQFVSVIAPQPFFSVDLLLGTNKRKHYVFKSTYDSTPQRVKNWKGRSILNFNYSPLRITYNIL